MKKPIGIEKGYNHAEAFCLMLYKCKDCGQTEMLWNSRDGVTPFSISCTTCKGGGNFIGMSHVAWQHDKFNKDYKPQPGMRIFVDLTKKKHDAYVRAQIERDWDRGKYKMKDHFDSKEAAFTALSKNWDTKRGEPDIVTVGEEDEKLEMETWQCNVCEDIKKKPCTFITPEGMCSLPPLCPWDVGVPSDWKAVNG